LLGKEFGKGVEVYLTQNVSMNIVVENQAKRGADADYLYTGSANWTHHDTIVVTKL
jgi:hypothetical protein